MPVITGSALAEVTVSIARCWEVVEDVPSAPEWQGGLLRVEVLERDPDGRALVCEALSDAKLLKVRTRQRFEYEPPTRLSWIFLEGDLDSMEGYWELEDLGEGRTRVTYGLAVDPGPLGGLIARPLERAARAILVNPRPNELARRVQSGG